MPWRLFSSLSFVLLALFGGATVSEMRPSSADLSVVALLQNNVLIAFDVRTGAELHRVTLPGDSAYPYAYQYLANDAARKRMVVLTADRKGVTAVDLATFSVTGASGPVGERFSTVAIGPVTGSPYLIGQSGSLLTVVKLDADLKRVRNTWRYQLDADIDWFVHDAGISALEDRILVSYHGSMTTGIDWFEIAGDSLRRCPTREYRQLGCLPGHGSFVQAKASIYATTGTRWVIRIDGDAVVSYDITLDQRNHVMELAIDTVTRRLIAIDACPFTGNSAVVDLQSAPLPWPPPVHGLPPAANRPAAPPARASNAIRTAYCGERVDALDGFFVIAKGDVIQVLESATARLVSTIPAGQKVVDLLLLQR